MMDPRDDNYNDEMDDSQSQEPEELDSREDRASEGETTHPVEAELPVAFSEETATDVPPEGTSDRAWFVIHCYSG